MRVKYLQVAISMLLLASFFYLINLDEIILIIATINIWDFFFAGVFSIFGNLACALRWAYLLNSSSNAEFKKTFNAYFESISFTTVIPVGILGGDIYRSMRISTQNISAREPTRRSLSKKILLSVVVDRVHGFWALCFIAFVTIIFHLIIFILTRLKVISFKV